MLPHLVQDMGLPLPQKGFPNRGVNPHGPADVHAAGQARHQGEGHQLPLKPAPLQLGVHGHGVLQPLREGTQKASNVHRSGGEFHPMVRFPKKEESHRGFTTCHRAGLQAAVLLYPLGKGETSNPAVRDQLPSASRGMGPNQWCYNGRRLLQSSELRYGHMAGSSHR